MALTLFDLPVPSDWARQTPFSDPGEHAALLDAVEPTPTAVGAAARSVIAHYRGAAEQLPESGRTEVNLRWVAAMLAADQRRHPGLPLTADRPLAARVQGNCRDHSLLAVSILRHHGVPARTRVGFPDYVVEGWRRTLATCGHRARSGHRHAP